MANAVLFTIENNLKNEDMLVNSSILNEVKNIIAAAKEKAIRAIDNERVLMYWHIGKAIFEEEQQGKDRADYGSYLIRYLSEQLQPKFGSHHRYGCCSCCTKSPDFVLLMFFKVSDFFYIPH